MGRRKTLGSALLLVSAALSGCARNAPPAPVEVHGHQRFDRGMVAAQATQTEPGVAIIRAGDTLYSIARRHNTPMRAIIDANRLDPPYVLQPGQRLTLPRVRTHVVRAGDTMYGISRRYDVEMSSLVRANAIEAPYNIMVGQTLILPGAAAPAPVIQTAAHVPTAVPAADAAPAPVAAPRGTIESAPLAPVTSAPLLQRDIAAAPASPPASASEQEVASAANATPAPAAVPQPAPAPARVEAPPSQVAAVEPAAVSLPARASRVFLWPVQGGRVISDFGPKGAGMHNDGINIAAPKGAAIRAAENGVVVYAGNELRGFGNLLLLRHADGWMTAYGHADEILVARGAQVRRGEVIGRVGATGNVTAPQVHFEIRRGSRAVNPREYLASSTASSG